MEDIFEDKIANFPNDCIYHKDIVFITQPKGFSCYFDGEYDNYLIISDLLKDKKRVLKVFDGNPEKILTYRLKEYYKQFLNDNIKGNKTEEKNMVYITDNIMKLYELKEKYENIYYSYCKMYGLNIKDELLEQDLKKNFQLIYDDKSCFEIKSWKYVLICINQYVVQIPYTLRFY